MPRRTIETIVRIGEDRRLIVQLPADVPVGAHHVVAILDETIQEVPAPGSGNIQEWTFPVLTNAQWPADMPLSREEMYGDDGR